MSKIMAGIAGIRGVVGDGFSPDLIAKYGAAFGTFLQGGKVVVGGDTRASRHMVRSALFSGLNATGCDIIDLGLATTPTIEIMVKELGAAGGVCITASHNPVSWNAMKFLDRKGHFLGTEEGGEVNRIYNEKDFDFVGTARLGKVTAFEGSGLDEHIRLILEHPLIDVAAIRKSQFRVAIDAVNSVGNLIMPVLLQELGCDVVKINGDLSGEFGRGAEPVPGNLSDLSDLVVNEGADIGLALDPDGDRLAIVNEQGTPIGEESTLALAVKYVLSHESGPVVVNLSTSRAVEDLAKDAGVDFYRTPVGEAHVATQMEKTGAIIGGEGNGGVMLASIHSGRDAMVGTALILTLLAEEGDPISFIHSRLPRYKIVKRSSPAANLDRDSMKSKLQAEFGDDVKYDNRDGVRIDLPKGWVQVRLSNTEPIARLFAEASTTEKANALADRAENAISGDKE
ncbi:MAG: phosphoglucosamine mutase [Candidatus Electryonea clarkiae]|nr:phosphoglucosamine mutase [Candidatus Electryonea clarkiae]MDP8287073.1 phosphoglucosamine mutase [Candidatus Electryonea clarkiae]